MKRYVAAMIRDAKTEEGLTEENFKVCSSNRASCLLRNICFSVDYVCKYMLYVNLVIVRLQIHNKQADYSLPTTGTK